MGGAESGTAGVSARGSGVFLNGPLIGVLTLTEQRFPQWTRHDPQLPSRRHAERLGHANVTTTARYLNVKDDYLQELTDRAPLTLAPRR